MTVATPRTDDGFHIEECWTGLHAGGYGQVGDGRTFSFHLERDGTLVVRIYRPGHADPVPTDDDLVATATRRLTHIDLDCERSLAAAVRDAVAGARPTR